MTALVEATVSIAGRLERTRVLLEQGTMTALVGPNGGGKTSLLRALAQVEEAGGEVKVGGERLCDAPPNRRSQLVGFLPASRDLAWPISVRDLLRLGLPHGAPVDTTLEELELTGLAGRRVDRLSTGERSRALIGRLLAAAPCLLLLDEPLSNLDPYWVRRLAGSFRDHVEAHRSTALISLHDFSLLKHFDRVVAVASGGVAFDGRPDAFLEGAMFERIFRISPAAAGLSRPADPRSSP